LEHFHGWAIKLRAHEKAVPAMIGITTTPIKEERPNACKEVAAETQREIAAASNARVSHA
jgi:hypothetical protein